MQAVRLICKPPACHLQATSKISPEHTQSFKLLISKCLRADVLAMMSLNGNGAVHPASMYTRQNVLSSRECHQLLQMSMPNCFQESFSASITQHHKEHRHPQAQMSTVTPATRRVRTQRGLGGSSLWCDRLLLQPTTQQTHRPCGYGGSGTGADTRQPPLCEQHKVSSCP